jgi:hypothetical protein
MLGSDENELSGLSSAVHNRSPSHSVSRCLRDLLPVVTFVHHISLVDLF